MKKQDLEYLLETLNYGLNDCYDKNGNAETHFNLFANSINIVQDELNLLNINIVSQQRELLLAYKTMLDFDIQHEDTEESVEYFLKHKDSYL